MSKSYQTHNSIRLQWGQRLSALDTDLALQGPYTIPGLQWGQRLSALDTAFSPRFSLIIPLFGGECRHFARGSFFWMQNRARFEPVRAGFSPLFCERPFLGGSPPERSQRRFDDGVGFTRAGGEAYSAVKERRAPRYAARGSARFSSGQRGISDSWTPRTSSASRQKLLKASSLTG